VGDKRLAFSGRGIKLFYIRTGAGTESERIAYYGNPRFPRCQFIFFKLRVFRDGGDLGGYAISTVPPLWVAVARRCILISVWIFAVAHAAWQAIADVPQLRARSTWRRAVDVSLGDSWILYGGCGRTAIIDTRCKTQQIGLTNSLSNR
jgi:hypothetical protein